ncbi:hypothetical protein PAPHI01_1646 [Pancytospora philotis]|nr:hypothetical protein PAPHI01_1646 [Pancytospora philotis]
MKTFGAAYINLLKTSIGSGVLNFPYLFKTYGIAPTVALTVLCGFLSATGLLLLAICAQEAGRSADLSVLAQMSVPQARIFVDLAVFIKCFGVSTSYIIITRQLLPPFIETVTGRASVLSQPQVCLFIFLCLIGPFTFLIKMDQLKYTSFVGLLCIVIVIIASSVRYAAKTIDDVAVHIVAPVTVLWLTSLGKFIFSFTCHQNIFAVNAEMLDNSVPKMKRLIYCVSSTAFVLYMSFGLPNYLLYGDGVADNVLKNYPPDYLATFVRGLYVVVMGVSYPLQVAPARVYLMNMLGVPPEKRKFNALHIILTFAIIFTSYMIAAAGIDLGIVYTIVGATASTAMALILPAVYYFHMDVERTLALSIAAYCAFLFGIVVFSTTLVSIVMGLH